MDCSDHLKKSLSLATFQFPYSSFVMHKQFCMRRKKKCTKPTVNCSYDMENSTEYRSSIRCMILYFQDFVNFKICSTKLWFYLIYKELRWKKSYSLEIYLNFEKYVRFKRERRTIPSFRKMQCISLAATFPHGYAEGSRYREGIGIGRGKKVCSISQFLSVTIPNQHERIGVLYTYTRFC